MPPNWQCTPSDLLSSKETKIAAKASTLQAFPWRTEIWGKGSGFLSPWGDPAPSPFDSAALEREEKPLLPGYLAATYNRPAPRKWVLSPAAEWILRLHAFCPLKCRARPPGPGAQTARRRAGRGGAGAGARWAWPRAGGGAWQEPSGRGRV